MECIFCKIAKKEVPAEIVYEDEEVLAFRDIRPIAPVHVLIIPKKHIGSVQEVKEEEAILMGKLILAGKKVAEKLHTSEKGYKLLFRVGEWGGQEVQHIHLHVIGGAPLHENIHPVL